MPSSKEQGYIRQALQFNRPIPDSIVNAPLLEDRLNLFFCGFFDLDSERHQGFGSVGNIPMTAMLTYCRLYGIDDETTQEFIHLVKRMDIEYVKYQNRKSK
jgi:hypothetical protein